MEQHSSYMLKLQHTLILTPTGKIPGADLSPAQPQHCTDQSCCARLVGYVYDIPVYTWVRQQPTTEGALMRSFMLSIYDKVKIHIVFICICCGVVHFTIEEGLVVIKVIWGLTQGFQCYGTGSLLIFSMVMYDACLTSSRWKWCSKQRIKAYKRPNDQSILLKNSAIIHDRCWKSGPWIMKSLLSSFNFFPVKAIFIFLFCASIILQERPVDAQKPCTH